jgi:nucleoid-associated protein YgaU
VKKQDFSLSTCDRYRQLDWLVTPTEPDEVTEPSAAAPETADVPPRGRRRWPWLALLTLILAAVLGAALGVGIVLRGRSFGAQLPVDTAARPTFVIAAQPSPSPSGSPRSSAPPATTSGDEYTVEAGDTLRAIAQEVYGDPSQWPRIYDANRQTIGPDPDTLSAGTRLSIPRP